MKDLGVLGASKKLILQSQLLCYMSKEEELTSSQESSVLWECSVDLQTDPSDMFCRFPDSSDYSLPAIVPSKSSLSPLLNSSIPLPWRSHHQVREGYFQKLQKMGMLPDKPRKKSHHAIVFDWDDTLFCTSYMSMLLQGDWTSAGDLQKQKVTEIDQIVEQILLAALELAEVTIVTNSVEGWVDFCSETFMPNTHALILNRRIDVISARDRYQREYPNDPQKWKTESFNQILNEIDNETLLNVMSIGDSNYEMQAADQSTRRFSKRFIKTLRLRQKPRGQQLLKQLKLINSRLRQVFCSPKTLTIKLQPKQ